VADQAFLLDLGRCIGCQACVVACKTGNELDAGKQYIRLVEQTRGEFPNLSGGFKNQRCYHCADAACVTVCPTGALFKDGSLTRLDRQKCSGCAYCVEACPYDVPEMVDGFASKCDGCAATVNAGGTPWCVTTCPSRALQFGDRNEILAEAQRRTAAMSDRHPRAQVYGETQAGGLGVLIVAPDDPEILDLPADPKPPIAAGVWQRVVQPGTLALTAATAVAAGVAAVIARRNHNQELATIAADAEPVAGTEEDDHD
jgi:formate dehydrogenase iron-sulfur subunit